MQVEVCYAEPDRAWRVVVTLVSRATVADALDRSGIATLAVLDLRVLGLAVFGRRATMATELFGGDRVELLRPLVVDPKEARRRRAAKRSAGTARTVTCNTAKPGPAAD